MAFKISEQAIKAADNCIYHFACLSGDEKCLCAVDDNFNGKILFIKPHNHNACSYRMSFGYSYICKCPVRKEIFMRYQR